MAVLQSPTPLVSKYTGSRFRTEVKGNARCEPKIVLDVSCVVRQGGAHVVRLHCANTNMLRKAKVQTATKLHREGTCRTYRSCGRRKGSVEAMNAAK
jgi:hypothetical protein